MANQIINSASSVKILKPLSYKYLGLVGYEQALKVQEKLHSLRKPLYASHEKPGRLFKDQDLLLLLQHQPTYTEGRRKKILDSDLKVKLNSLGAEYLTSLRGGQTTFHGPGQLVGYPIINLKNNKLSTKCYVHYLEEFLVRLCGKYGIKADITKDTGVWVGNNKIAAIGILIRQFITTHGFALNCNTDLNWFNHIIPCGLEGKGVTSITNELLDSDLEVKVEAILPSAIQLFAEQFGFTEVEDLSKSDPELDEAINKWIKQYIKTVLKR